MVLLACAAEVAASSGGELMSDQAKKFLAQWEREHIEVVPRSDREAQARRLALWCRQDAVNAGISDQELEAVVEGNLVGNMLQALDDAEFRRLCRDQSAAQERDTPWADRDGDLF
jgi:hypothetical protein